MLEEFLNNLMIDKIQEYGKKKKFQKVIDIGGKDGKYTSRISENLTIVDLNPVIISPTINYVKTDIMEFETKEKFDLVVSSAFIEHISKVEVVNVLKKVNYLLKDDGFAFLTCPNAWSINRLLGEIMGICKSLELSEGDKIVGHKFMYNLPRLEEIVKENLIFVESGSYFLKPLPASDMNKIFDISAFRSFASINSNSYPQIKDYLAEIYIIGKKREE